MNISRRRFCHSAFASSVASTLPASIVLAQSNESATGIPARIPAVTLDRNETSIEGAAVRELGESLQGSLLLQGDYGYDGARRLWNGEHDKYPALIVRAQNAADVANAVTFARERELLVAVKGGGHSWPGRSAADGALMIDLGDISDVLVDVEGRTARAGGGSLLYNLDFATTKHGLVTTAGVVSHTGVGGYTLGGGYGRLNRKFGLTIDNLLSAEIVTPDGQVRRVSAQENADLFWAIRGGGGNFGVVTQFEYRVHEANPVMLGGDIVWPIAEAQNLLEFFAEYSAGLSDEMYAGPYLAALPDGTGIVAMDICYCGDLEAGRIELAPLAEFGNPLANTVVPTPYVTLQTRLDGAWRPGLRSYAKNGMVGEFSQGLIDALVENFDPTEGVFIGTHTAGGAVARVGETDTAWPHRNVETMIVIAAAWTEPEDDERFRVVARRLFAAIEPYIGGYYDNIDSDGENASGNYGPAYDRLLAVKNAYDPMNLLRLNSNVQPTV
jgi:hypothetical protein